VITEQNLKHNFAETKMRESTSTKKIRCSKAILFIRVCCAVVFTMADVSFAQETKVVEEGRYTMFLGKDKVGSEHYTLHADNAITTKSEMAVMGKHFEFDVTLQYEGNRPVKYQLDQSGVAVVAEFQGDTVTITGPGRSQKLGIVEGIIVLENNIFEHYYVLLQRYDMAKGGKQTFPILVPTAMVAIEVTAEYKGAIEQMVNQQLVKMKQFQIALTGMLVINIMTDENLHILKLAVPLQNVEVIREGYDGLRQPPNIPDINSDKFESADVTVSSTDSVMLSGTLTIPKDNKKKHSAVIMITGSGPQDREENTPPVLNLYIFRYIANDLASHGIAVLRCDDRGVGKSTGDFRKATLKDFVNDAKSQVAFLRTRKDIDGKRIGVIGHSEGGIIVPIVASEDKNVAACVILAGTARPLDVVMNEQLEFQAANVDFPQLTRDAVKKMIEPTKQAISDAKSGKDSSAGMPYNLEWLRQHFAHDPIVTIKKVKCPVLILQGEKDMQVLPYHAGALEKALGEAGNRDHKLVVLSNLTHLFTEYPYVNGQLNPDAIPSVSPKLLDALTPWLEKKLKWK
jgi:alpha-beta hydrolase superfamily lysophospholipase